MELLLNGESRQFDPAPSTVKALLEALDLAKVPVVVEHNHEALLPREHDTTLIQDGDRLEIVRVVAGG